MKSVLSILLGIVIAWVILTFISSRRSNYLERLVLHPADVMEPPAQNSALIGAGLATAMPSVMDATPASSAQPVMMGSMNMSPISVTQPQMPMQPQMPTPMMPPQMPMQPQMPTPMMPTPAIVR